MKRFSAAITAAIWVSGSATAARSRPCASTMAVAVWRGDLKLGYVPRAANRPLARLLAEGARIEADVMRVIADSGKDRTPFAYTSYGEGDPVIRATRIEA